MNAFRLILVLSLHLARTSSNCPEKCICLWYIDYSLKINCSGSEKTEVPHGINPQVKILDLSHNEITSYSHSKLLRSVQEIDLSDNQLTQVSFGTSMKHLVSIDLSHNSIADLKKVDVHHLKNLKKLDLSYNTKLQKVFGLRSDSLQDLNLSNCLISYIEDTFLEGVPKIRFVDLSFNSFRSLKNVRSFSLQNLDASHSQIEALTRMDIFNLPDLLLLNVSFNPNMKIDFSYENTCWNVQNLDLSNSRMTSLNDMFPFCSLKVLNASLNLIDVIEVRTFFNNCELLFVNLSQNRISQIHHRAFFTAEKLKTLDLSSNQIPDLVFTLHLKQVQTLDLSKNQITTLIGLMMKNVLDLNLSENKITEVWMNFNENAPRLKTINLSRNSIKHLGRITSKSISSIDLSFSGITSVELNAFEAADSLITVNLIGNKLTILDYRTFKELTNLNELFLADNPWSCRCETAEFKELYQYLKADASPTNAQELKCVKTNDTWKSTCQEGWRRQREWKKTVYSLTVSLALAVIVVGGAIACKNLCNKNERRPETESETAGGEGATDERLPNRSSSFSQGSSQVLQGSDESGLRNSTPPPNYEAALLLPKLTDEQVQVRRSTESLVSNEPGPTEQSTDESE